MKFKTWLEMNEPWAERGIGSDPIFPDAPVKMVPITSIKPIHGRNQRPAKPIDPTKPYEPLRINDRMELQDGYHRYYDLIDAGYQGEVPVVVLHI